jgi:hypothetical protein
MGIPDDYLIQPIKVVLTYLSSGFHNVLIEVARDEVGSASMPVRTMSKEVGDLFEIVGLARPEPISLISIEHQVAQKIHACTTPLVDGTNDRAHDLVDIQLCFENFTIDMSALDEVGRRLFALRGQGAWPPSVRSFETWPSLYSEAAGALSIRPLDEAIDWLAEILATFAE